MEQGLSTCNEQIISNVVVYTCMFNNRIPFRIKKKKIRHLQDKEFFYR